MSPKVFAIFADIVACRFRNVKPAAVLEVGAGSWTLLSIPHFAESRKVALNMNVNKVSEELKKIERVLGNSNALDFANDSFDCVLSCSALEHDREFWRSIAEIRRVLKPGGYFVVGVPIYMTLRTDYKHTTLTYARHGMAYNADFYRFSEQTVREVFFEGYSEVTDEVLVRRYPNPYLVMAGCK